MPTAAKSTGDTATGVPIADGLVDTLGSWSRPVVIGHVRPDADCLASMLSVALTWPGEGRRVAPVSLPRDSISQRLAFLVEWADASLANPENVAAADGFVVVDTAKKSRCNVDRALGDSWSDGRTIVNIDHHVSNTQFGQINWVDPGCGSGSEMIYRLIRASGRPITPLVASLLFAGIHSDTVGFSLPTTTASALSAAAGLVSCGARVADIGERLCRSQTRNEFDLNRIIYDNTRIVADGRIAYSTASYDEITGAGCTKADIDDQVSIPRSVSGIQVALLMTEGVRHRTRLNIRGEADVDVLSLAVRLGGGGHAQAAGAVLDASIDEALEQVLPMVIEQLDGRSQSD